MRKWMNEEIRLTLAYMDSAGERTAILASMEDLRCVGGRIVEKKVDQARALACLGAVNLNYKRDNSGQRWGGGESKCKVFIAEFFNTNEEVTLNTAYVCAGCMLLLI